ncbi:MAG: FixH family protein [Pseudomonadota bacterium]
MNTIAWYRQPWPWVLIAIPFSAVAFGIVMFSMAMLHPDDLVVDNYYKDGMAINVQRDMDARAVALGVAAESVSLDEAGAVFRITGVDDASVQLDLHHVTDQARDVSILLSLGTDGLYRTLAPVAIPPMDAAGIWYLELHGMDGNWRLQQRVVTPSNKIVMEAR